MIRFSVRPVFGVLAALVLSMAVLLIPFASAPAFAGGRQGTGHYRAELAAPLAAPRQQILDGVVWTCEGTGCIGSTRSGSRPVIVCGRLAARIGSIVRFADGENELDAEALRRCNGN